MVDREFQAKTNALVQNFVGAALAEPPAEYAVINRSTIEAIQNSKDGSATKVINLIKLIQRTAEEKSDDPFLIGMADRAKAVQEAFEARQDNTEKALEDLIEELNKNEARKLELAASGLDSLTYFVKCKLIERDFPNADTVAREVREAFVHHPNWRTSEAELREVRNLVTIALFAQEEDLEKVTAAVDELFTLLQRSYKR